jgi:hypothetical protein
MIQNFEQVKRFLQLIKDKNNMNENLGYPHLDYTLSFRRPINEQDVFHILGYFDKTNKIDETHYQVNSTKFMYNLHFSTDFNQTPECILLYKPTNKIEEIKETVKEEITIKTKPVIEEKTTTVTEPIIEEVKEEQPITEETPVVEEKVAEKVKETIVEPTKKDKKNKK